MYMLLTLRHVDIQFFSFLDGPESAKFRQCQLVCLATNSSDPIIKKMANKVIDGTPCIKSGVVGVCISGRCKVSWYQPVAAVLWFMYLVKIWNIILHYMYKSNILILSNRVLCDSTIFQLHIWKKMELVKSVHYEH